MKKNNWFDLGYQNIWHPYTQMLTAEKPIVVTSTEGVWIELENGTKIIDAISCWWVMCHGHKHPHIVDAMQQQLEKLPHILFADIAHQQAYLLANRLVKILPVGLERVFFSDSGSVAVEVAMKIAVQYWHNLGQSNKKAFIAFEGGYHGDTMGAMSLSVSATNPAASLHAAFLDYIPEQYVIPIPKTESDFIEFSKILQQLSPQVAGLFIEPLVQCVGGMLFHEPEILAKIYKLCKSYNILFIADEIATGFGRTGKMFASEEAEITPDIICLGKALTGGMVTLAATVVTGEVFSSFLSEDATKALMHGPTYMANPLACSAANASLDLFETEPRLQQVARISNKFTELLSELKKLPKIKSIRIKGAIIAIECHDLDRKDVKQKILAMGVYLRPLENVIYCMPPFIISDIEIEKIVNAIKMVLSK